MRSYSLDSVSARDRLQARNEPYWQRLDGGAFLGYRRGTDAAGTWSVKFRDPDTLERSQRSLGTFGNLPPSERYSAAKKAAEVWLKHMGRGGKAEATSVEDACRAYVEHLRGSGRGSAADDADARFRRWVYGSKFGRIELQKLKPGQVDEWRKSLAVTPAIPQNKSQKPSRPRASSTLNRDMNTLRAALNCALEDGYATDDSAWRNKLRPIANADGRRDVYLDLADRRKLIAHAQADVALFIRALSLLPLRPGAVAALTVRDYLGGLNSLRIGKDKAGADRRIPLPPTTAAFLAEQCKNKPPTAPILTRADGVAWNKDSWKHPLKAAVKAAAHSNEVSAYALRHSTITDLIVNGLDTLTVSQLAGTSLLMIEKHYGHLRHEHAAAALAKLAV
jgi:integrase